jgi:hypothetical protein
MTWGDQNVFLFVDSGSTNKHMTMWHKLLFLAEDGYLFIKITICKLHVIVVTPNIWKNRK